MLATAQSGPDFHALNDAAKKALRAALDGIDAASASIELKGTPISEFAPFPADQVAMVESGLVSVVHNGTVVSLLDPGDLLLPDSGSVPAGTDPLRYGSESGAKLRSFSYGQLMASVLADPERQSNWSRAVANHISLLLRINALHIRDAGGMGGTPEIYPAGAVIIQQGDPADDIFSMTEGLAEVLVNDMPVAKIRPGELFGTMAALTGSHRNATVRAQESCSIIRVAKDRFFELIRSRPAAVQGLLVDMAKSITELNEEVVSLRRRNGGG